MRPAETPHNDRHGLGGWNAYVIRGTDSEDRRARLAEVPEHWRERVRAHVVGYFAVKARARNCAEGA